MTDTISRADAIERMRDGLPCETCSATEWFPTRWKHFDPPYSHAKFRIPPEPRREAREFRDVLVIVKVGHGRDEFSLPGIHVREVLPDEVVVRMMTEDEIAAIVKRNGHTYSFDHEGAMELARALGLLKESGS